MSRMGTWSLIVLGDVIFSALVMTAGLDHLGLGLGGLGLLEGDQLISRFEWLRKHPKD